MVDATGRSTEVKEGKYAIWGGGPSAVVLVGGKARPSRSPSFCYHCLAVDGVVAPDALRDGLAIDVVLGTIICLCVDPDQVLGHI